MLLRFIPLRADVDLSYHFPEPDVVGVTMNGSTDTFDFRELPDAAEAVDIHSVLSPCPVLSAKRVGGRLEVLLLRILPAPPRREDYETDADYEAAVKAYNKLAFPEPEVVWE